MPRGKQRSLLVGTLSTRRFGANRARTGRLLRGRLRWARVALLCLFVAPLLTTSGDSHSPLAAGIALLVAPTCLALLLLRLGDRLLPAHWVLPGGIVVQRQPLALALTLLTVALLTIGSVALPSSQGDKAAAAPVSEPIPTLLPDFDDVIQIVATYSGSFALKSDGSVWGWGDTLMPAPRRYYAPTPICASGSGDTCVPLTGVTKLFASVGAASAQRVFAVKDDGTLWAWGTNNYGQLGDGTQTTRTNPVQVVGLTDVIAVASGSYASFAITDGGDLWSWGSAHMGLLGDGVYQSGSTTLIDEARTQLTPQQLTGLPPMIAVSTLETVAAAVDTNGQVWDWGEDNAGPSGGMLARTTPDRCGSSTFTCGGSPGQVTGLSGAVSVAVGFQRVQVVFSNGSTRGWGDNSFGELGDGTTTVRFTPTLSLASDVEELANNFRGTTGALMTTGDVLFWGARGVETNPVPSAQASNPTPITLTSPTGVTQLAIGDGHQLALDASGHVYAWGSNSQGQLGLGDDPVTIQHDCLPCDGRTAFGAAGVSAIFGNFVEQQQDFVAIGAGLPATLARTYNSVNAEDHGFGVGWTYTYGMRVTAETDATVLVRAASGRLDRYYLKADGTYAPPADVADTLVKNSGGTWTLTTPDQAVADFDTAGLLAGLHDRFGNALTIAATSTGQTVTNPAGRGFTLTYGTGIDANHFVALTEVGGVGRTLAYAYSAAGDLIGVTDVRGGVTAMTYDSEHRLLTAVDPGGATRVDNTYDMLGRVEEQHDGQNLATTLAYERDNHRTISYDDNGDPIATYGYDDDNNVVRVTDRDGNIATRTFNAQNRLSCATDPTGGKTAYTYDSRGNVTAVIDPLNTTSSCQLKSGGVRTTITYNAANQPLVVTDPLGHATTYAYDSGGYLTSATNALSQVTAYTYVTVSLTGGGTIKLVETVTDPLSRVTTSTYTGLGQVATVTDPLSRVTTLGYDAAGRLVTTTDPGGIVECREYDNANHLTAVVQHCVAGQPATVSQNVRTEYGYDADGRQIWVKGPTGEVTRTEYEARGLVAQTIAGCYSGGAYSTTTCAAFDPAHSERNRTTAYTYDLQGRPEMTTDTLGVVTRVVYDNAGRPFETTRNYVNGGPVDGGTNLNTETYYDPAGRVTAVIDPRGRKTTYGYDLVGRQIAVIQAWEDGDPATGSWEFDQLTVTEYDAAGRVIAVIAQYMDGTYDPNFPDEDHKTVTEYDALNRPVKVIAQYVDGMTDPGEPDTDLISETIYDAAGNIVATSDPLGRVTVTAYDALNRTISVTRNCTDGAGTPQTSGCDSGHGGANDENLLTETTYTVRGQVDTRTDVLGRVTKYTYDDLGRVLTEVTNYGGGTAPANVTTSYIYDAGGRVLTTTDPLGKVWTTAYNGAGWATSRTDPTSRTTTTTYDGLGRIVGTIDGLGHERRSAYDVLGRVVQEIVNYDDGVVDGSDGTDRDLITTRVYDRSGRLELSVAPGERHTEYSYTEFDTVGLVIENVGGAVAPADVDSDYYYDRRGLLVGYGDANGDSRERTYDATGRLTGTSDGLGRWTTYTYDRGGRQTSSTKHNQVTVSYAYDQVDRPVQTSATGLATVDAQYDAGGRRTYMGDGNGSTTYTYDGLDRVASAASYAAGTMTYGWDSGGRRTSLTASGGGTSGAPTLTYLYDDAGRPTFIQRNGGLLAEATYDAAGRLATVARTNPGNVAGATTTYAYDGADRVTGLTTVQGATTVGDFGYAYDRNGQATGATEAVDGTTRTVSYSYDGLGRVAGSSVSFGAGGTTTYAYTYDLVGNRTGVAVNGVATQTRSYDGGGQVVGWAYDDAGQLTDDGTRQYTWDPLGQLASVTQGGVTTLYAYTGDGDLLGWYDGTDAATYLLDTAGGLTERFGAVNMPGGGSVTSSWYSRGWGGELAREVSSGGGLAWYLGDRLGSVRAEYDGAAVTGLRLDYDPFGEPEAGTGLGTPSDYGYTGEPQDSATGLVQLRARWYRPGDGVFASRDPWAGDATTPQTLNPYSYAHNDPINGTDPTGRWREGSGLAAFHTPTPAQALSGGRLSFGLVCFGGGPIMEAPGSDLPGGGGGGTATMPVIPSGTGAAGWPATSSGSASRAGEGAGIGLGYLLYRTLDWTAGQVRDRFTGATGPAPAPATDAQGRIIASPGPAPRPAPNIVVTRSQSPQKIKQASDEDCREDRVPGKYGHLGLTDMTTIIAPYKGFEKRQRDRILDENRRQNAGKLKSDFSGIDLVAPANNPRGNKRANDASVDHICPQSRGGSNSYANAQVLSVSENSSRYR